jgi:hypothetical protein
VAYAVFKIITLLTSCIITKDGEKAK